MDWMYRMVAARHMSADHILADDSRRWLANRVDAADGIAVRDRKMSTWWESTQSEPAPTPLVLPSGRPNTIVTAAAQAQTDAALYGDDGTNGAASSSSSSSSSRDSNDAGQAATRDVTSVVLSLNDVLSSPAFLEDYRAHLEELYCAQGLDFLDEHEVFDNIDPKAYPTEFLEKAKSLYDRYIDTSSENSVSIPDEVRDHVDEVVTIALGFTGIKAEQDAYMWKLKPVFEEARQHVLIHMEGTHFQRFLKSDDYQEMLAVRFEEDLESAGAAALFKSVAWENKEGFKTIRIVVNHTFGLTTNKQLYCQLTVDSRTYRTAPVAIAADESGKPSFQWNTEFQFALLDSTHHVKLEVFAKGLIGDDDFMGRAILPVGQILDIMQSEQKQATYRLLPRKYGDNVVGDLVMSPELLKEEAKDMGHKLIQTDDESTSATADFIRGLVSKKKKRFKADGFNLDLTYVTPRIIAMGFPSEKLEGVYRNNMKDVQRLFEKRHAHAYKVYNLCSERFYDASKFHGRVARYPFDDHNPPSMDTIKAFCIDCHNYLNEHPQNVVAIHCKAGKGRTGTVIACYFLYARLCPTADEALNYFAVQRTKNVKGVTIPSQKRYVHYFDHYCRLRRNGFAAPTKASLFLTKVLFHNYPSFLNRGDVWFEIIQNNRKASKFSSRDRVAISRHPSFSTFVFDFDRKPMLLSEDIRVEFYRKGALGKEKLFQAWFNTRYVVSMQLEAKFRQENKGAAELLRGVPVPIQEHSIEADTDNKADDDVDADVDEDAAEDAEGDIDDSTNGKKKKKKKKKKKFEPKNVGSTIAAATPHGLSLKFDKWNVDKICKDTKNKQFPADFMLEFRFLRNRGAKFSASVGDGVLPRSAETLDQQTIDTVADVSIPDSKHAGSMEAGVHIGDDVKSDVMVERAVAAATQDFQTSIGAADIASASANAEPGADGADGADGASKPHLSKKDKSKTVLKVGKLLSVKL
jgi:phosphatidylinositol-3,4,5-trisphosphate 3-phosphatase and dual-specificity protein phosphatase PTEN